MNSPKRFPFFMGISLLLTIVLSITGCNNNNKSDEPTNEADAPVQTDIDTLAQFMTLPTPPLEATWVRYRSDTNPLLPDPNYRVIAVLRYDAETIASLQNEVLYLVRNNLTIAPSTASPWFPEPLKAELQAMAGQTITTYHPKPFYKDRYGQGLIYFVGEYAVIELRTETW